MEAPKWHRGPGSDSRTEEAHCSLLQRPHPDRLLCSASLSRSPNPTAVTCSSPCVAPLLLDPHRARPPPTAPDFRLPCLPCLRPPTRRNSPPPRRRRPSPPASARCVGRMDGIGNSCSYICVDFPGHTSLGASRGKTISPCGSELML